MAGAAWAIIADDLTGAADTALQFAARGLAAEVVLRGAPSPGAAAVALSTGSRHAEPEVAYQLVRAAAGRLAASRRYKKIDSTMRGSVGREVEALLDVGGGLALLAPAFPAQGRAVVGGRLLVRGAAPGDADVAGLARRTARGEVAHVGLAAVRAGPGALREAARAAGARIVAVDAETDSDLDVVAALLDAEPGWLPAGSAGLAAALARRAGGGGLPQRPAPGAPVLTVVGSVHAASRGQLAHAARSGAAVVTVAGAAEAPPAARALAAALRAGRDALLASAEAPMDEAEAAALLGEVAASGAPHAGALVLTGGDTALAVLARMGVARLRLAGQVAAGVPACAMEGGDGAGRPAALKSGGFGDEGALLQAARYLRGLQ